MWWKAASVIILAGVFLVGLLVPLYPGIETASPENAKAGNVLELKIKGYNTFFSRSGEDLRLWLAYNGEYAISATEKAVEDDRNLNATFEIPNDFPVENTSLSLDLIVDDAVHGAMFLPSAVQLTSTPETAANDSLWSMVGVTGLHENKEFRFTNIPINYESIRNLYFHVPMWMVMFVMFFLSVWHSIIHLGKSQLESDVRAAAYAETGLLFGVLGLVTGMLWATYTWGAPWSNDIKQLMTAAALLVYVAYFILRTSFDEPEKGARISAVYNIFAFAALIPLIYIVPRIFSSLHPGGEGNPVFNRDDLNVNMRLVFYPAVLGWTLLGLWVSTLRIRYKLLENKLLYD
jgi:heme exporter protein C